jgi:hypothetical protein
MDPPFTKFIRSDINPLGVEEQVFANCTEPLISPVRVLEYKYSLDALIEEIDTGAKSAKEIGLAICWELCEKWKADFEVLSFLDKDNVHHREFHGVTHQLSHGVSRAPAFQVIVLKDLLAFIVDLIAESDRQRQAYTQESDF